MPGAVKLRFSPQTSERMPRPWASAGTMYLFSEGSEASDISASVEDEAAIDRQELAGDEACTLPQQEDHPAGNILARLDTPHRAPRDIEILALLRHLFR